MGLSFKFSHCGIPLKNYLTWWLKVSEKTKVCVDTYNVKNEVTIRLNSSIKLKYQRTNNKRTMVTEKNLHLVPHDNS